MQATFSGNTNGSSVVVGSPHEAITKSVASDLERRGYIVFVTVSSTEEERVIQNEGREDIRSLWLDLSNVCLQSLAITVFHVGN